jgi:hypothetical protein
MDHHTEDYDDHRELDNYLCANRWALMTPFEQQAEALGIKREKARHAIRDSGAGEASWAQVWLAEFEAEADQSVGTAIGADLNTFAAFQARVTQRIRAAFLSNELRPNRCPSCRRIVRTPKAQQCLWCGHDWHNAGTARRAQHNDTRRR